MTRLHYWLHAKTQYNLHSPFLFEMYREVLFARLTPEERQRHSIPRGDRFHELVYKCSDHYHLQATPQDRGVTRLSSQETPLAILLVDHPHATPAAERRWELSKTDPDYQVSIDLYDVALLIHNPHLSPQHFLLR